MFPLREREIIRGCQAHIIDGLGCAEDYEAYYTELYAPFAGAIRTYYGKEGGNWLDLIRKNGERIQMAHLSKYVRKSGVVKEGELIAITGNTGSITSGPHLHIQIKNKAGKRLDPGNYVWDTNDMTSADYEKKIRALNTEIGTVTVERDTCKTDSEEKTRELNTEIGRVTEERDNYRRGLTQNLKVIERIKLALGL